MQKNKVIYNTEAFTECSCLSYRL